MGHGTSHTAKVSYSQMQAQMKELGYENVFIGTVEGEPEETACEEVIKAVSAAGYKKVILRPLMVVAGDHANNDMAGDDDDSWKRGIPFQIAEWNTLRFCNVGNMPFHKISPYLRVVITKTNSVFSPKRNNVRPDIALVICNFVCNSVFYLWDIYRRCI